MISVAVLKTWDNATYKAGVQLVGSLTTYFDDVNVARNIDNAEMLIGRQVIVATPEGNPRDAVVIAVYTV
ncbi:MAG: hypothetical protein E3J81_02270 [Dehalococcoidia bacterium]|nr:MAG: hypothetical protein E3J81_02270 [Dehalococcoidia bacterium]